MPNKLDLENVKFHYRDGDIRYPYINELIEEVERLREEPTGLGYSMLVMQFQEDIEHLEEIQDRQAKRIKELEERNTFLESIKRRKFDL